MVKKYGALRNTIKIEAITRNVPSGVHTAMIMMSSIFWDIKMCISAEIH
jgi:hypothetical protein